MARISNGPTPNPASYGPTQNMDNPDNVNPDEQVGESEAFADEMDITVPEEEDADLSSASFQSPHDESRVSRISSREHQHDLRFFRVWARTLLQSPCVFFESDYCFCRSNNRLLALFLQAKDQVSYFDPFQAPFDSDAFNDSIHQHQDGENLLHPQPYSAVPREIPRTVSAFSQVCTQYSVIKVSNELSHFEGLAKVKPDFQGFIPCDRGGFVKWAKEVKEAYDEYKSIGKAAHDVHFYIMDLQHIQGGPVERRKVHHLRFLRYGLLVVAAELRNQVLCKWPMAYERHGGTNTHWDCVGELLLEARSAFEVARSNAESANIPWRRLYSAPTLPPGRWNGEELRFRAFGRRVYHLQPADYRWLRAHRNGIKRIQREKFRANDHEWPKCRTRYLYVLGSRPELPEISSVRVPDIDCPTLFVPRLAAERLMFIGEGM